LGKLENDKFVIDKERNTIIGMVSGSYVAYDNKTFLDEVLRLLDTGASQDNFDFKEAYAINTELTIRFTSEVRHGSVSGKGGIGEDRSNLGLDFKNSMVGTSAVRINYFLERLACANGMMVPAANSINRVYHSGQRQSFDERLNNCFREVHRKLDTVVEMLHTLGAIEYSPHRLAMDETAAEQIFGLIPALKSQVCEFARLHLAYPQNSTEADKKAIKLKHDASVIDAIPDYFSSLSGQRDIFDSYFRDKVTLFDFLNIFTEFAKRQSLSRKLEIEENAGKLAKYIADHKKKFIV
jgi:hypothetical protein